MDEPKADEPSLVEMSINFRANLFRKDELPEKLTTERGRFEEGIWGMQELSAGNDDFVVVFGRTWEGVSDDRFIGVLDSPEEKAQRENLDG